MTRQEDIIVAVDRALTGEAVAGAMGAAPSGRVVTACVPAAVKKYRMSGIYGVLPLNAPNVAIPWSGRNC